MIQLSVPEIAFGIWIVLVAIGYILDQFIMPLCFDRWNTEFFGLAFCGGWAAYMLVIFGVIIYDKIQGKRNSGGRF
ncbi:MAG TPA: hypothetical protein GXX19_08895 [Syntrophomonadaceae bacterium]|nr:hypothetical protein [Syntrophomonadaceae bacterium]